MGFSCEPFPRVHQSCAALKVAHPDASREHRGDHFEGRLEIRKRTPSPS